MKRLIMCDVSSKMLERGKDVKYDVNVEGIVVDNEPPKEIL